MKSTLFILALLLSSHLFSQHLSEAGHFIDNNLAVLPFTVINHGNEVEVAGDIKLEGNAVYEIPQGYLTLSGEHENTTSSIRLYTSTGKIIFDQAFTQTINFSLSGNKKFCVFHDSKKIYVIDLANHAINSFEGSNSFSINNDGQVAYYNENNSTVSFGILSLPIAEVVYTTNFFNNQPLFITKKAIYTIKGNTLEAIFHSDEGRVFEAATFNDKLFISVKKETPTEFVFRSYSSSDLFTYSKEEEIRYPLMHNQLPLNEQKGRDNSSDNLRGELIRCPLNYANDNLYQPVGNSYDEIQEYSSSSTYLHPGVDLLGVNQQKAYSVQTGFVKGILTTGGDAYWRIATSSSNMSAYSRGYLYAHIEKSTIPYATGDVIKEGDVIGKLTNFPVAGFVHCHFARVGCQGKTWTGNWGTFDNPLRYMTNFKDTTAPQFEKTINKDVFAFRNASGTYLSANNLSGKVSVISKIYDRINATWHCDVDKIRYSVSPLASPQTNMLDKFAFEYSYYNDMYVPGKYYPLVLSTIYSRDSKCMSTGNYDKRAFYHIITNSDENDTITTNDALQMFNTLSLPNASYIFRVTAWDASNNSASDSMVIVINNIGSSVNEINTNSTIKISPNPFTSSTTLHLDQELSNSSIFIYNSLGEVVKQITGFNGSEIILQREGLSSGIYQVKVQQNKELVITTKLVVADY